MIYETAYIDQRKEKSWPGVPNWAQCFYSSMVMFLTHWIKPSDPESFYAQYFDDVETMVGNVGIGEDLMKKYNLSLINHDGARVRSGQYWAIHCDAATAYLAKYNTGMKAVWADLPWTTADEKLASSPLVCGTRIPPSDGHIILLAGEGDDGKSYHVRDPYGNGLTGYAFGSVGNDVLYPKEWLKSVASWAPGTGIAAPSGNARVMWGAKV